jgi:hypothetical protein
VRIKSEDPLSRCHFSGSTHFFPPSTSKAARSGGPCGCWIAGDSSYGRKPVPFTSIGVFAARLVPCPCYKARGPSLRMALKLMHRWHGGSFPTQATKN